MHHKETMKNEHTQRKPTAFFFSFFSTLQFKAPPFRDRNLTLFMAQTLSFH